MPLDKLVLILICVVAAAGATVFVGAWLTASGTLPWLGLATAIPFALIAYVIVRVISDRLRNSDDNYYDKVEK